MPIGIVYATGGAQLTKDASCTAISTNAVTSLACAITTSSTNDIFIATVSLFTTTAQTGVTVADGSVCTSGGGGWTKRYPSGSSATDWEFYCKSSGTVSSDTITASFPLMEGSLTVVAWAGADYSHPFAMASPGYATGTSTTPSASITTNSTYAAIFSTTKSVGTPSLTEQPGYLNIGSGTLSGTITIDASGKCSIASGANSCATPTLTVGANELIIVTTVVNVAGAGARHANAPTATGLTFTFRTSETRTTVLNISEWYVFTTSSFSNTITCNESANGLGGCNGIAISAADGAALFDTNAAIPAVNQGGNNNKPTVSTVSTSHAHDKLLGLTGTQGTTAQTAGTCDGSTCTIIIGGTNGPVAASEHLSVSATQSSATVAFGTNTGASNGWVIIADAIQELNPYTFSTDYQIVTSIMSSLTFQTVTLGSSSAWTYIADAIQGVPTTGTPTSAAIIRTNNDATMMRQSSQSKTIYAQGQFWYIYHSTVSGQFCQTSNNAQQFSSTMTLDSNSVGNGATIDTRYNSTTNTVYILDEPTTYNHHQNITLYVGTLPTSNAGRGCGGITWTLNGVSLNLTNTATHNYFGATSPTITWDSGGHIWIGMNANYNGLNSLGSNHFWFLLFECTTAVSSCNSHANWSTKVEYNTTYGFVLGQGFEARVGAFSSGSKVYAVYGTASVTTRPMVIFTCAHGSSCPAPVTTSGDYTFSGPNTGSTVSLGSVLYLFIPDQSGSSSISGYPVKIECTYPCSSITSEATIFSTGDRILNIAATTDRISQVVLTMLYANQSTIAYIKSSNSTSTWSSPKAITTDTGISDMAISTNSYMATNGNISLAYTSNAGTTVGTFNTCTSSTCYQKAIFYKPTTAVSITITPTASISLSALFNQKPTLNFLTSTLNLAALMNQKTTPKTSSTETVIASFVQNIIQTSAQTINSISTFATSITPNLILTETLTPHFYQKTVPLITDGIITIPSFAQTISLNRLTPVTLVAIIQPTITPSLHGFTTITALLNQGVKLNLNQNEILTALLHQGVKLNFNQNEILAALLHQGVKVNFNQNEILTALMHQKININSAETVTIFPIFTAKTGANITILANATINLSPGFNQAVNVGRQINTLITPVFASAQSVSISLHALITVLPRFHQHVNIGTTQGFINLILQFFQGGGPPPSGGGILVPPNDWGLLAVFVLMGVGALGIGLMAKRRGMH